MIVRSLALVGSACLLASCATAPRPAPNVAVPTDFYSGQAAQTSPDRIDRWWKLFDDPQLDTLVDEALRSAPDARIALARLHEAESIRRGALTPYDPQGNPTMGVGRTDERLSGLPSSEAAALTDAAPSIGTSTAQNGGFNISWEVDLFGRRGAARRSADADLAAARFDYQATRLSLEANVASGLFNARGLAAQIIEAQETLRIAHDLAQIAHLRASHGLAPAADAARLDTDVANARSDLLRLQAQLSIAQRTLFVLLGMGTSTPDSLPIGADLPMPPRPPRSTPAAVMARRPDVREAEQNLASAMGQLQLDRLALFPRLTFEPGASFTRVLTPVGYTETAWTLAAGLFMPVLDRARLLSQLGAQSARQEQAVIAYERAIQGAFGEAENSLTSLSADFERLEYLEQAERRAQFAFSAQQQDYKAGIIDLATLLQTEQAWRTARIAIVVLKTSTLTDAVTCFKSLGGGWDPEQMSQQP